MNKRKSVLATFAMVLIVGIQPGFANAAFDDNCGIGALRNADNSCSPFWMDWSSNDGFVKETQFIIQTAATEYLSGYSSHLYLSFTLRSLPADISAFHLPKEEYAMSCLI